MSKQTAQDGFEAPTSSDSSPGVTTEKKRSSPGPVMMCGESEGSGVAPPGSRPAIML